jgi:plastocyanin
VRRLLPAAALGAVVAAGALAGPAGAATVAVAGLDDGGVFRFSPADSTAAVGDTVAWGFASAAAPHNVNLVPPGVDPADTAAHELLGIAAPAAPAPFTKVLGTAGVWRYYCSFHGGLDAGGMSGRVVVGDVAPPPPLPTGPAPSPNTLTFAGPFEEGDVAPPRLRRVGVLAGRRSVRVRFLLSEPARVTVRAGGRSAARTFARAGVGTVAVRRVPARRQAVRISAVDRSGLATTIRRSVRVRG